MRNPRRFLPLLLAALLAALAPAAVAQDNLFAPVVRVNDRGPFARGRIIDVSDET